YYTRPPFPYEIDPADQSDLNYLYSATLLNSVDTQPDIFFYNFNGTSGKFIFGQDGKPIIIENQNILISYNNGVFKIVDEVGNQYIFDVIELQSSGVNGGTIGTAATCSWYLSQIYSYNNHDQIS